MTRTAQPCPLCAEPGGTILWESSACRVIRVDDPHYPGFCRVIWGAHVREMSDLDADQRNAMMGVVDAVEKMVRKLFVPDKINLASFGNMVPHLHWHVIPRWQDDRHFPEPVWGAVQREAVASRPQVSNEAMTLTLQQILTAEPQP